MSYCANCGTELNPSEKFCPKCGHNNETEGLPKSAPAPSQATATPAAAPRRKLSGCAIAAIVGGSLFAIIGIVIVIAMVLAFSLTSPAVDAVNAHLAALKQGQVELAYQGTSSDFQGATSLDAFRQFVDSYPVLKDVAKTSFDERSVENNLATLKGRITNSTGAVTAFNAQLSKEGDSWKVQALDLPGAQAVAQPPASQPAPPAPVPSAAAPGGTPMPPAATPVPPAPAVPAVPATPPTPATPTAPTAAGESSVGTIVIGAGRNADRSLVNPGQPIPVGSPKISADIALINHPQGERVQVWIEQGTNRTEPIEATVEGTGSGNLPFELNVGDSPFPAGRYTLVVGLGGTKRFTQEFEIK
jgi:hypothetical protein